MYKSAFILLLLSCLVGKTDAQRNNNWIFGFGVNLTKNDTRFSSRVISSVPSMGEGCGTVSDPITGNLLFYTNGESIWNRNDEVMPNGGGLKSNRRSTQTGLILPVAGQTTQYYVFTAPKYNVLPNDFLYSNIVDMSLNNGLGDVLPSEKNIPIADSICEAMTYTYNADSSAYWLIVHKKFSNRFLSFKIDENGIDPKVVESNVGLAWGIGPDGTQQIWKNKGYMKVSPNGKKLAVTQTGNSRDVAIYDFDNCTGEISNELILNGNNRRTYACEFSPSSQFLYYTTDFEPSCLYQIDLFAGDSTAIRNSNTKIVEATNTLNAFAFFGLQLHKDNKIYLSELGKNAFNVINDPNEKGADCNFSFNQLDFSPGVALYGLPQIVPENLKQPSVDTPFVDISINDSCLENGIMVTIGGVRKYIKRSWTLIDENNDTVLTSAKMDFDLSSVEAAEYTVKVELFTACKNYTFQKLFTVKECFCEGDIALEDSCAETPTELSIETRYAIDSVEWIILDSTDAMISNNTQDRFNINLPLGNYKAIAFTYFSCGIDTIETSFTLDSCFACEEVFLPNAFTPNADGVNDMFGVTTICQFDTFSLEVFNRWGTQVFETYNPNNPWDGKFKGERCVDGVYFFTLWYRAKGRTFKSKKGRITLLK